MNTPASKRQTAIKRDPWEGLTPQAMVELYQSRGVPAELGPWGPRLDLSAPSEQAPNGHALVIYDGREGETAWKKLVSLHPEAPLRAPRWSTPGGGRALLLRQPAEGEPLLPCELSACVSVVTSGTVSLPGSVEGSSVLRWKPDAHLGLIEQPSAPQWLVRFTMDEGASAREVLERAADQVEDARAREEAAVDHARARSSDPSRPRPSRVFDRGDSVELAAALLADLRSLAPSAGDDAVIYDRSTFWVYDPTRGIYVEHDLAAMCRRVSSYAGAPCGPKGKPLALSDGAVKGAVKAASWQVARPGFLDGGPCGIAFADRFVTARDGEVVTLPLSHEHRAIHALPFPYEMDAPCHKWSAMLREVFRRVDEHGQVDEGDTEACISLLGEWTGSALVGEATSRAVSLVLVGAGNDGKSSVLNVIRSLFPPSAVCSVSPQEWGRGFLLAVLAGKRLNVVSELPEKEIIDSERFKAVVSGDPLTAERKNQDPFDLICQAGQVFASNGLPPTRDQSDGFWRRFAVIPCDRRFQAHEVVRDLWREVVAEELAGIAAWAIEGAARAQRNQALTSPASSTSAKADWQHDSDAVRQFVAEACVALEPGAPSSVESGIGDLYEAFRRWCAATGHTVMARDKLARRLKGLGLEHRTKIARLYRLRVSEPWARAHGLTLPFAGGYGAPN